MTETIMVPESAIQSGFHEIRSNEMARQIQAMLGKLPKTGFLGLKPGIYMEKTYNSHKVWQVHRVTPSGKQADVSTYGEGSVFKIYAGDHGGDFSELDETAISYLGVTHRMIVAEAVSRGLDVPNEVRREYPDLFIEIPERFRKEGVGPAERVRAAMSYGMSFRVVGEKTVVKILEQTVTHLGRFLDLSMQNKAMNDATDTWYDRAAAEFHNTVDFYTWLRPLVAEGGIFYVEGREDD